MKRGQAALEYMMVIAFGMLILMVVGVVYFTQSSELSDDRQQAVVDIMGNEITTAAEQVYYAGSLSKKTLRYEMPNIVNNIAVTADNALVFNVTTDGAIFDLVYYADVPITGYFPETKGYTQQIAHILVYNCGDEVLICSEEIGCSETGDTGCPTS